MILWQLKKSNFKPGFFWFHLIPSWTLWRVWWRWEVLSGLTVQLRSQAERIQRVRRGQWCGQGERGGQWQHWQQSDSVIHWHWAHRDNYSGDTGDSVHILNDCLVTWYLPSMGESWAWSWSRVHIPLTSFWKNRRLGGVGKICFLTNLRNGKIRFFMCRRIKICSDFLALYGFTYTIFPSFHHLAAWLALRRFLPSKKLKSVPNQTLNTLKVCTNSNVKIPFFGMAST